MSTADAILAEISKISLSSTGTSKQLGKKFYSGKNLKPMLREYYAKQYISKAQFARDLDISPSSVSNILGGSDDISDSMVFRIQNYFQKLTISENTLQLDQLKIVKEKEVQVIISSVSLSLLKLQKLISKSNTIGSSESDINPLQKAQLIALLETMLTTLKAPIVNISESRKFFDWLKKVFSKGIEQGIEKNITDAMDETINQGSILIDKIAESESLSSLSNLF